MRDLSDHPGTPQAPGEQTAPRWIARSTRKLGLRAALVWLALALLLAGLQWAVLGAPPGLTDLARRLGQVALPSAMFLVAPSLVIAPVFGLLRGQWQLGLELGLNLGLLAFMGTALLWAGVGVVYALDKTDPWENMPWVTPPYLEAFIAAHPQLEVHKLNGVRDVQITHRTDGGWMRVDGNDLAGSAARFERCTAPPRADELGGLPAYPGWACRRVLTLTRPSAPGVCAAEPHGLLAQALNVPLPRAPSERGLQHESRTGLSAGNTSRGLPRHEALIR